MKTITIKLSGDEVRALCGALTLAEAIREQTAIASTGRTSQQAKSDAGEFRDLKTKLKLLSKLK
ncbi:MAG TPA: hypothetical protein VD994_07640 [Prosthecobacter sp.]|nr:hypothetical protein [Prosthecobacter sp.]